jgi:hypothetical protein
MDWSKGCRVKVICILLVYSVGKSTHLYSITGSFLIRQVLYPGRSGRPRPTRPEIEAGRAGLLRPLDNYASDKDLFI